MAELREVRVESAEHWRLSVADAASHLAVSSSTIYRWLKDPASGIPYDKRGSRFVFSKAALDSWRQDVVDARYA